MKNKLKKAIILTDLAHEQAREIAIERGIADSDGNFSYTDLVKLLIANTYAEMQPPAYARKKSGTKKKKTAEEKVQEAASQRESIRQERRRLFLEEKTGICHALNGEVVERNGAFECNFTVYDKMNPKHITETAWTKSFENLTQDTIKHQFRGDWTEEEKAAYLKK